MVVVAKVVVPTKVLSPVNDCVVVDTSPRARRPASGMLKVCTEVVEVMVKSVPVAETAKVCPALVNPFNEVIPPPAPASAPQTNCPVVASHSNFPAGSEHDVMSPAPYKAVMVVVASVEVAETKRLVADIFDVEALVSVV